MDSIADSGHWRNTWDRMVEKQYIRAQRQVKALNAREDRQFNTDEALLGKRVQIVRTFLPRGTYGTIIRYFRPLWDKETEFGVELSDGSRYTFNRWHVAVLKPDKRKRKAKRGKSPTHMVVSRRGFVIIRNTSKVCHKIKRALRVHHNENFTVEPIKDA